MRNAEERAARRLERRLNRSLDLRAAFSRAGASIPAILQIVAAATASYAITHFLIGHSTPVVAVTVTISVLGFARDARPRRVIESVIGILVGIILSEAMLLLFGTGVWQIALVLFVTLLVARLLSPSPGFAILAGVQSMLVMLVPAPDGGVFTRSIDGAVAGVVALVVTALIPRDPRRIAQRDARRLFSTISESLGSLVEALQEASEPAASLALDRLRRSQKILDDWAQSQDTAIAVARVSPFLRRHLPELRYQAKVLAGMDLASRHLRVIARRITFLVRDGEARPAMAGLLGRVSLGVELLGRSMTEPAKASEARAVLEELVPLLDPEVSLPGARMPSSVVVLMLRPLVVDMLVTAGASPEEARTLLPPM